MSHPALPHRDVLHPALWLLGTGAVFLLGYRWTNAHAASTAQVHYVALPWDAAVPFWAWTIVPYLSLNLLLPLAFFLWRGPRALNAFGWRVLLVMGSSFAVFWAWPTASIHSAPVAAGFWQPWFSALRGFEQPFNQLPSLHLALLVLTWRAFAQTLPRAARWPWALLCGLIGLSTLTTWQHGLADVMLGTALGALACWRLPR